MVDASSATLLVRLFVQPLGGVDASAWDFSAISTVSDLADQLGSAGLNLVEGTDYQLLVVGQDDNGTAETLDILLSELAQASLDDEVPIMPSTGQNTIIIDIQAHIDGSDILIINDNTFRWHHLAWAAVGRHSGRNDPTIISTSFNGIAQMNSVSWIPTWSAPPPNEIRSAEFSSIYSSLSPSIPNREMTVSLERIQVRSNVDISQQPTSENGYQIGVTFDDSGLGGSTDYYVRLKITYDGQLGWTIPLELKSSEADVDGLILDFGMSPLASDGYDESLETLAPPLPQSPIDLYAFWEIKDLASDSPTKLAQHVSDDYRPVSNAASFRFQVYAQNESAEYTISWEKASIPADLIQLTLKQVQPTGTEVIDMRHQASLNLLAQQEVYIFEIQASALYPLVLQPGWNMVSLPGQLSESTPTALTDQSETAMLPMFSWNPSGYSYQQVDQIQLGKGYWLLSLDTDGESLSVPVTLTDSYTVDLKPGWNLIGSVSEDCDFSQPVVSPEKSIAKHSLFEWKANGSSYQKSLVIKPGKGYWVLCWNDCQLTVDSNSVPAASPSRLVEPTSLIVLRVDSGQRQRKLEIGWDSNLEGMDYPLPPMGPQESEFEVYLAGEKYHWSRQIRPTTSKEERWQMKLKSRHDVQISIESNQGADGQELVIEDGEKELLLRLGQEVRLESGDRYLSLYIRPMNPQVSQVLQNYPNPFNPETWIPYQLSQEAAVSLQIYDGQGRLVRKLELGWKEAGYYTTAAEAIYWDGRNANGESVSSGLYFYRLQAGDYSQTRKMVILK